MKYIICFKLKRRNARRKEWMRFTADDEKEAKRCFNAAIIASGNIETKNYELLTGDWKHICFYTKDLIKEGEKDGQMF